MSPEERHPLHQEIAKLRGKVDDARQTIRNLRDLLAPPLAFPLDWGLTGSETRMLAALYSHPCGLSKEALHTAIDVDIEPSSYIKIVDVIICHIRRKVGKHGVKINTIWGRGYLLAPESRATVGTVITQAKAVRKNLDHSLRAWL